MKSFFFLLFVFQTQITFRITGSLIISAATYQRSERTEEEVRREKERKEGRREEDWSRKRGW